jgi:capsular polysaccharide biosynthesis protein
METRHPDNANSDLLSRIPTDAFTVLDVGCGAGALGAGYRVLNPAAHLFGIERDPDMAAIAAQRLDAVACVDVEQNPLPFELPDGIDCLIYGDVLQQLRDPWAVLRRQLDLLNPTGTVLICVANAEHWSMVARLFRGTWDYERAGLLDVSHLRWFSLRTITRALTDAGLVVEEVYPRIFGAEQAQQFLQTLAPGLQALGIALGDYDPRALPLQYVLRARSDRPALVALAKGDHSLAQVTAAPAPVLAELAAREEVPAADIAKEIVYIERSRPFVCHNNLEPGPTLTDETAQPFACPPHTADIRSFRFSDVALDTACMLLFDGDRPIKDTHYLLHDTEYRDARILPDRLVEVSADQPYIIGCNRRHTNYYHWLIQALPAMDWGVRMRRGTQPHLALPPLAAWQERSLELLELAALPRLTLDIASQYLFPDVEYSEFLNGWTAFRISERAIETFRRMRSVAPSKLSDHSVIYVARTDTRQRVATNESELIDRMEQEGIRIIVPGSMQLDEQINTFRAARLVIGPHGAGLSNIVFCEPGAVLYELIPDHYQNGCINRLALAASMHYTADLFPSSGEGWVHDRTWEYDLDLIIDRVKALKARCQQVSSPIAAARPALQELPI